MAVFGRRREEPAERVKGELKQQARAGPWERAERHRARRVDDVVHELGAVHLEVGARKRLRFAVRGRGLESGSVAGSS